MLHLNKKLSIFGKTDRKLWSFCKLEDETTLHFSASCTKTNILWAKETSFAGFSDINQFIFLVLNLILILSKGATRS